MERKQGANGKIDFSSVTFSFFLFFASGRKRKVHREKKRVALLA